MIADHVRQKSEWETQDPPKAGPPALVGGKRVTAVYLVPEGYERVDDKNGYTVIVKKGTQIGTSEEIPSIDF